MWQLIFYAQLPKLSAAELDCHRRAKGSEDRCVHPCAGDEAKVALFLVNLKRQTTNEIKGILDLVNRKLNAILCFDRIDFEGVN